MLKVVINNKEMLGNLRANFTMVLTEKANLRKKL